MGIFWTNYAFYVLGRIECFLNQKNEVLKIPKYRDFLKGLVHGFCQKIDFFKRYFLGKLSQKSLLFDVLGRKEYFLHQKSEVLKKSKKSNFSKLLVHGFRQKIEYFFMGIFWAK